MSQNTQKSKQIEKKMQNQGKNQHFNEKLSKKQQNIEAQQFESFQEEKNKQQIDEQISDSPIHNEIQKESNQQCINPQNSLQQSSKLQNTNKHPNSSIINNERIGSCNCKKSKCLKMYCDCFAKGNSCRDTCKCTGCQNTKNFNRQKKNQPRNEDQIQKSSDSNKKSIRPKERACNCKKSFCLKKYCQCFNAGQPCTQICKCQQCKNNGQNNGFRNEKLNQKNLIADFNAVSILSQVPNDIDFNQKQNIQNFDKKEEQNLAKKRQKLDEDEIETKITQILKLIPQQNYQTMLDFLAYCLS